MASEKARKLAGAIHDHPKMDCCDDYDLADHLDAAVAPLLEALRRDHRSGGRDLNPRCPTCALLISWGCS